MKRLLISIVAVAMLSGSVPACVFADDETVSSKMYEIHVTKKYVFVKANKGIYRVRLRNGKPVSKKRIVKCGSKYAMDRILVKGKFVYFKKATNKGDKNYLYRVKKSGGRAKRLATMGEFAEVAFKGKKIYYSYPGEYDADGKVIEMVKKVMKLNGKGKKNTDIEAKEKDRYSSKKGYKYAFKATKKAITLYLKTPKGKIALEKI